MRTEEEYRRGGWRCFHCDETFTTPGAAEDHFGNYLNSTPGCVIKVQVGDERGWLMELRRVQEENKHLRQQMDEEYWNMTAYAAHLKTHIQSYRPFRKCETLRDVFNVYDSMEGRALSAEERLAAAKEPRMTDKPSEFVHRCGPSPCRDCQLKSANRTVGQLRRQNAGLYKENRELKATLETCLKLAGRLA